MDEVGQWATAVMVYDRMFKSSPASNLTIEPKNLILQKTRNVIISGEPTEYFSNRMPVFMPKVPEEDGLRPIDVLYGLYLPQTRTIEIFINRIRQDAKLYSSSEEDLTFIVRAHEYAHAVVHSGLSSKDAVRTLNIYSADGKTDWKSFESDRDTAFYSINTACHELIAQAVTYASILQIPDKRLATKLTEIFFAVEGKQPADYRLSQEIKQTCQNANWPLVLDAARGQVEPRLDKTIDLDEGITALIRETAAAGQL